ncbi:ChaN family lipoprotein [Conservatibacter flavescens]|uniref:Haem-binding uptake Tiki superfamily ChaN domain-containing protein n=1 Tax=Conservatibacter flavescens TaxID=28161 RepID=A0A2M8S1H9_9PAST|nr:ChaN family lipoprotein [Conservatibacter flavescens]PJG84956.1 hypothetical protein CVP05_08965 [Conservatibacter flavescens]
MMKLLYRIPCVLLIMLCGLNTSIAHAKDRIIKTATQQVLTVDQLVEELLSADIVLLGEIHNDRSHHEAQRLLLEKTAKQRAGGSVVLEMLMPSQQKAINEVQQWFHQGGKSGLRSLAEKINWNHAWDWRQYKEIMNMLLHQSAAIVAGSPDDAELKANHAFVPTGKYSGQESVKMALTQLIQAQHKNDENLVALQQYKDYKMARQLQGAKKPAWLIAGNIHVSKQLGVPLFLQDNHFSGKLKVLMMVESKLLPDVNHADYLWITQ